MNQLISFIIQDIEAQELLVPTVKSLELVSDVMVITKQDFVTYDELEEKIKEKSIDYKYICVVRLGDTLSPETVAYIPEFLYSSNIELVVNYVTDYGFNSEPLKWCKRTLIARSDKFRYDGIQIVPSIGIREFTELEVYNNIGVNLRFERLKMYNHSNLLISSQIQIMDEWFSIRQYAKAKEIGHKIMTKSASREVRDYVLNQLSSLSMVDQNKDELGDLIEMYASDLSRNPLVIADYNFAISNYEQTLEALKDFETPSERDNGLPFDRERFIAYVYLLQARSHLYLGKLDQSIECIEKFYTHSIILRNQINYVKQLQAHLKENPQVVEKTTTTPPKFMIVSQPRTGSTLLQQLLNSHPDITCYGELLAINKPRYGELKSEKISTAKTLLQRTNNSIDFVSTTVSDQNLKGFKLLLFQLENYQENLWPWLLDNGSTKIIYLKRRDVIKTYVSFVLASQNNYWQTTKGSGRVYDTVEINLTHFRTYMEKMRDWETLYMSQSNPGSVKIVYYEDLFDKLEEIQTFLGVAPQELTASTKKQGVIPLKYIVKNLREVENFYAENPIYK